MALQTADPSCRDDSGDIYVDCGNGTVTDNRTGLVWLRNANCLLGPDPSDGQVNWFTAREFVEGLADLPASDPDDCGLSDGSSPGEWRLPSIDEWEAMIADAIALGCKSGLLGGPSITNDSGDGCWQEGPGNSFTGVVSQIHWSSTTDCSNPAKAWFVNLNFGFVLNIGKTNLYRTWPVRGGQ